MGCGVPYALAAKLAHPERPVIALVGDGAMQMSGISALHRRRQAVAAQPRARHRLGRSAPHRARAQQPRPELRDVGAARDGGRSALRGDADASPTFRTPTTRGCSGSTASASSGRRTSRRRGSARSRATGPSSSTRSSIATCRRCRRSSRPEQEDKLTKALTSGDADADAVLRSAPASGSHAALTPAARAPSPRCRRPVP